MSDEPKLKPIDPAALWSLETFTDGATDIRVLMPVDTEGKRDTERKRRFFSTVLVTYRGRPMHVNFEIPATTLVEAMQKFVEAGEKAGDEYMQKMKDMDVRATIMMPPLAGPVSH